MFIKWQSPSKPEANIETPATITRRPYRCRMAGQTVHFGVETGAHYADRPRVSYRADESKRETENPRFVRAARDAWGRLMDAAE